MIAVVAGRRPDPPGHPTPKFPLENIICVREQIRNWLKKEGPDRVVCSAACGADLLVHDIAADLGISRTVVLPYGVDRFRATSVSDRPGGWGPLYDRLVSDLGPSGLLLSLDLPEGGEAYRVTTERMVHVAFEQTSDVVALAVWEGGGGGETGRLLRLVAERGGRTVQVLTTVP